MAPLIEFIGSFVPFRYSGADPVMLKPRTVKPVLMLRSAPPSSDITPAV